MKPPPRKRSKPERSGTAERVQERVKEPGKWQRPEHVKLLNGLKSQSRTANGTGDLDLDHSALKKSIRTRSVEEIQSQVDSLKDKVISSASSELERRRREERKVKKPVELWTDMASSVTGSLEETINTAFAQMLVISSTEPRTLRNCDPPNLHRQTSNQSRPVGRTVPPRPVSRPAPSAGVRAPAPPLLVLKTPVPSMDPVRRLSAPSKVLRVPLVKVDQSTRTVASAAPSCQTAPTAPPQPVSNTPVTTVTAPVTPSSDSSPRGTRTQKPSEQQISSPPPSALSPPAPPSISSLTTPPPPPGPAAPPAGLGGSSRLKEDSPGRTGVKCAVDFERIYKYLSVILKPDEECQLTPMEGAIMLDLLMSLAEELPQLDCKELQKHLKQVYQSLSSPVESRTARDLLKDLQGRLAAPERDGSDAQQKSADTHSEGVALQPQDAESQSSASGNAMSNQDAHATGVCPPLNPFMVPVKLLQRREVLIHTAST